MGRCGHVHFGAAVRFYGAIDRDRIAKTLPPPQHSPPSPPSAGPVAEMRDFIALRRFVKDMVEDRLLHTRYDARTAAAAADAAPPRLLPPSCSGRPPRLSPAARFLPPEPEAVPPSAYLSSRPPFSSTCVCHLSYGSLFSSALLYYDGRELSDAHQTRAFSLLAMVLVLDYDFSPSQVSSSSMTYQAL